MAYTLPSGFSPEVSSLSNNSVMGIRGGAQSIFISQADTPQHKVRLYELFAQIEAEFDRLYVENRMLRTRLECQEQERERKAESSGDTHSRKTGGIQTQPSDASMSGEGAIKSSSFGSQQRAQSADEKAARSGGSEKERQGMIGSIPISASKEFATRGSKGDTILYKQIDVTPKQSDASGAGSLKQPDVSGTSQNTNLPRMKKATAQLSHRLKTTYKQHTSRLVSSFRVATSSSSGANPPHAPLPVGAPAFLKELATHRDGVWEVSSARIPLRLGAHFGQPAGGGAIGSAPSSQISITLTGTASADHTVRVFAGVDRGDAAASPRCVATYTAHSGSVNSVRFASAFSDAPSPTASASGGSGAFGTGIAGHCAYALTASGDGSAHIFRVALGDALTSSTVLGELDANTTPTGSAANMQPPPTADTGVDLKLPVQTFRHTDALICAEWLGAPPTLIDSAAASAGAYWFAALPEQVATASVDRSAQVWNVETADLVQSLTGHDGELTDVAACGRSRVLVTASRDCTFRVWDLREATTGIKVQQAHRDHVTSCRFFVTHNFCSAPSSNVPFVWYANQLPPHVDATHPALKLISSSSDRSIKIWDLRRLEAPVNECRLNAGVNKVAVIATTLSGIAASSAATSLNTSGSSLSGSPAYSAYAALALDSGAVRLYDLVANKLLPRAVVLETVLPVGNTTQAPIPAAGAAQTQFGTPTQFVAPPTGVVVNYEAAKHHHSVLRHARMATCCAWTTAQSTNAPNTELNAYLASSGFDRRVLIWKVKLPTPSVSASGERDAALKENKERERATNL